MLIQSRVDRSFLSPAIISDRARSILTTNGCIGMRCSCAMKAAWHEKVLCDSSTVMDEIS